MAIVVDGITTIENISLTEGRKLHNLQWVTVALVQFSAAEYTQQQAIDAVKHAKTLSIESEDSIITFYCNGMLTAKSTDEYHYVYLFVNNIIRQDNVNARVQELEKTVNTMLGGE